METESNSGIDSYTDSGEEEYSSLESVFSYHNTNEDRPLTRENAEGSWKRALQASRNGAAPGEEQSNIQGPETSYMAGPPCSDASPSPDVSHQRKKQRVTYSKTGKMPKSALFVDEMSRRKGVGLFDADRPESSTISSPLSSKRPPPSSRVFFNKLLDYAGMTVPRKKEGFQSPLKDRGERMDAPQTTPSEYYTPCETRSAIAQRRPAQRELRVLRPFTSHTDSRKQGAEVEDRGARDTPQKAKMSYQDIKKKAKEKRRFRERQPARQRVAFTLMEEEALREYIGKFGHRFSLILEFDISEEGKKVLQNRTQVDLKDKARNMAKTMIWAEEPLEEGFYKTIGHHTKFGQNLRDEGYDW